MAAKSNQTKQLEYLHAIYTSQPANNETLYPVDIVFVHGLNPSSKPDFATSTWTHEQGNFWPEAQLAQSIPSARILIFSYNSGVAWDVSSNGIQDHANNLLDRLSGARDPKPPKGSYMPPIIFVAHSLGGLVVKQALVTAKNNDAFKDIRDATYGLVFFAVPHQGGHGATLGAIAKNIVVSLTGNSRNDLVESLQQNSLFQENQANLFKHQLEDYRIVSISEDRPTKFIKIFGGATSLIIVDQKSATLGLAGTREKLLTVNSNHSDICKFESDDDKFEPIKRAIGTLAGDAIEKEKQAATERAQRALTNRGHIAGASPQINHEGMEELGRRVVSFGAPIKPVFGEVIYRPATHYNALQFGFFHAKYQFGKELSSRDSEHHRMTGLEILTQCETDFSPFNLPDGNQLSIDDLKISNFEQVVMKICDSSQKIFALLGWAWCVIIGAKGSEGEDAEGLYQKARFALYLVHHLDIGGVENTMAILKEIDAGGPWVLSENIMQQQRITNIQM